MWLQLRLRTLRLLSHQYPTGNADLWHTDLTINYSLFANRTDACGRYLWGYFQPSLHQICKQKVFNHLHDHHSLGRTRLDADRELHHVVRWQIYRGICFGSLLIYWAHLFEINYTKRTKRNSHEYFWIGKGFWSCDSLCSTEYFPRCRMGEYFLHCFTDLQWIHSYNPSCDLSNTSPPKPSLTRWQKKDRRSQTRNTQNL